MNKTLAMLILALLVPAVLFAQGDEPQKYALVIGNGAYTGSLSRLANPENDANDIALLLTQLGFSVEKILNGSQPQMESAILRLHEKLSAPKNSYGFFFYAGHGVQSNGENFLIPVDANIPNENYLRNRAVSVQVLLDDLNDAQNALNVVVLDACRDNPFGWSRGGSRGLAIVSRQPADSIIVYATSAGQRASDGEGRNGLFTSQLLPNLATPGIEVSEVFRRTGADVAEASSRQQIPAVYNQFFGTAFLGERPRDVIELPLTRPVWTPREETKESANNAKLWTVGVSAGSTASEPWFVATLHASLAPLENIFFHIGVDLGLISGESDVDYYSLCPFAHIAYYLPLGESLGVYAGGGAGYFRGEYRFPEGTVTETIMAFDAMVGINILSMFDLSYTLRTDFRNASNKVSFGYVYRF